MNTLLKDLGRYLLKFCWIIVICALLGGVLGFVTKKPAGEEKKYTYTSSAKIMVDIQNLNDTLGSGSAQVDAEGKVIFSEYNLAYSLLPTFKEILFSRNSVVYRVVKDYNSTVQDKKEKITADYVCTVTSLNFPAGALSFDITVTTDKETKSKAILSLMCKYGISKINEYSDNVKVRLSNYDYYQSSVKVSGEQDALSAFKTKIEQKDLEIFEYIKAGLSNDEYVQRYDVKNGYKFEKDGDDLIISFESNYNTCAELAISAVIDDEFIGNGVTADIDTFETTYQNIDDIYTERKTEKTEVKAVNNTIILALFGAIGATLVLTFIFIMKNGYGEKAVANEESKTEENTEEEQK
ncbi:MAG: hypothetical protein IKC83_01290 [Clostridia bacterium]|nr:hypothetical protein [Clostridia bacterium]